VSIEQIVGLAFTATVTNQPGPPMPASTTRALILMNARNCVKYLGAAIESLTWQTHPHVHVLFVDDCSSDGTAELAQKLLDEYFTGRHTVIRNTTQWGKARNAHVHLRANLDKGDFVAVLDADDQLIRADVVAEMAAQYEAGYDVVWTNYVTDQGGTGNNGPLDPLIPPRKQGWRTSHFFSFRAELFAEVPESHFLDDMGEWLMAACDLAIAFPILDQPRRYRFLPVNAYRYTATNPTSHHNQDPQAVGLSSRKQMRSAEIVLSKPPLPCRRWVFGNHAAGDQLIGSLQQKVIASQQAIAQQLSGQAPRQPVEAVAQDPWAHVAATTMHERCPGLLSLAMQPGPERLDVGLLWGWWQWLQRGPATPRVLSIGCGPLSAPLHTLVRGLGGHMTSISADQAQAMALFATLDSIGLESEVLHVPMTEAEFESHTGRFPNLAALPDEANSYDVVIVSADHAGPTPADSILSLPMVLPRLNMEAFRLCLWSPKVPAALQRAAQAWKAAAPDLVYSENAMGGRALIVQPC